MMAENKGHGIDAVLLSKREDILRLAEKYRATNIRVFGSVARGEATDASDIDFLVDFPPDYRLWDRIGLKQDLEDLLGRNVDIVLENRLRDLLREDILRDAVAL